MYCPNCKRRINLEVAWHTSHFHENGKWSHCYTAMRAEVVARQSKWDKSNG